MQDVLSLQTGKKSHLKLAVLMLFVVCILGLVFSSSSQDGSTHISLKSKSVNLKSDPLSVAINSIPNPPITHGAACTTRVILLVDRSASIINNAPAGDKNLYVNRVKNAVNGALTSLGETGESNGLTVEVSLFAFAARTVRMSNDYWPSTGDPLADFYRWAGSLNIANPLNRLYTGSSLVGFNPNDGIWFSTSSQPDQAPNALFRSPQPGDPNFANLVSATTKYPSDDNRSTNYEDAFVHARDWINFFTDPAARGDDDFDLVLMVTDGVPTSNNADLSGPWVTPDANDLNAAQGSINAIRLGAFGTIAPASVLGILAGPEASSSQSAWMDRTFGPGNYVYGNSDMTDLKDKIIQQISPYSCNPVKDVSPSIEIISASSDPPKIEEGKDGSITYTIKNNGDTKLTQITAEIASQIDTPIPFPTILLPGESKTFTHTFRPHISLGDPDPKSYIVKVNSVAVVGPNEHVLTDPTPSASKSINVDIVRIPLPT